MVFNKLLKCHIKLSLGDFSPIIGIGVCRDRLGWCGLDWSGSGRRQVETSCECGNEPSGFIKCGKLRSGYTTDGLLSSA
jgi:hypothetical protein